MSTFKCGFESSPTCSKQLLDFSEESLNLGQEDVMQCYFVNNNNSKSNDNRNNNNSLSAWTKSNIPSFSEKIRSRKDKRSMPKSNPFPKNYTSCHIGRKGRGPVDEMLSVTEHYYFKHYDDIRHYMSNYRRYHTVARVGNERLLILGHDVPDPYIAKLKHYGEGFLRSLYPATNQCNLPPRQVSPSLPLDIFQHSQEHYDAPWPHETKKDLENIMIPTNLSPPLHRENSLPVTNFTFPSQTIKKKMFSSASQSYLNLNLPKTVYPGQIEMLLDSSVRSKSSSASKASSGTYRGHCTAYEVENPRECTNYLTKSSEISLPSEKAIWRTSRQDLANAVGKQPKSTPDRSPQSSTFYRLRSRSTGEHGVQTESGLVRKVKVTRQDIINGVLG